MKPNFNAILVYEIVGCCDHIMLSFNTSTGDLDHGVRRHIGIYRKTMKMFEGQHTYVRAGAGLSISYLFYNEGFGWRVCSISYFRF